MVKSGLKNEILENRQPARVSPYRLAAHLGSAFALYLVTLAAGIRILSKTQPFGFKQLTAKVDGGKIKSLRSWTHGLAGMTFATAMSGISYHRLHH